MNKKISNKDREDWEQFLSNKDKLPDKDENLKKKNKKIIKSIDLHGYSLEQANQSVKDLIYKSYNDKVQKLIIVTGKGLHSQNDKDPYKSKDLAILKYSVPEFIKNNRDLMEMVFEIKDAEIEDGGQGAFYVFLKKKL